MKKTISIILSALVMCAASAAHAQTASNSETTPPATSPAKKELVQRILKLQQGGIERLATAMVEEPAVLIGQRASEIIATRIASKERQEAVAKELQAEMQKYLKDTVPLVRKSAQQLAPITIGPVLESKFTDDELRQVIAMLESPAFAKYQQLSVDMQQSLQARLVTDSRATVEPRVQALEKAVGEKVKAAVQASDSPGKPAAGAATKPGSKP